MKHTPLGELSFLADVALAVPRMSPRQRLARWADVLERDPGRVLKPLRRVEMYREPERALLRGDDSPLALAYADPILRDEGLHSDRLGDGRSFFGIGGGDIHALVCDCRYGGRMKAGDVGKRVRGLAHPNPLMRLLTWMRL